MNRSSRQIKVPERYSNFINEVKKEGKICELENAENQKNVKAVYEGVKDHKCDFCGKSFSYASNLKTHVKTVHEGMKD